jgi:glucose-6-phosphate isomerase
MAKKGLTGAELERQARHRVFPGNRPSTVLAYPQADPLRAGPDHRALRAPGVRRGVMLGINSFDQWGVELGKELATASGPCWRGKADTEGKDASTADARRLPAPLR